MASKFQASENNIRQVRSKATLEKKKHFNAADRKVRWGHFFRISVVLLNIFTSSTLFSILNQQFHDDWKLAAAITALLSSVMIGIAEYFKFEKSVGAHRVYGNLFGSLASRCETELAKISDGFVDYIQIQTLLDSLNSKYEELLGAAAEYRTSWSDYQVANQGVASGQESYTAEEMR